jgi:hypothetical protein
VLVHPSVGPVVMPLAPLVCKGWDRLRIPKCCQLSSISLYLTIV